MDSVTGTPSSGREDCWSEDATFTLIEAWGDHYLELNRGNLRQKHWQEVADAVNDSQVLVSPTAGAKPQPPRTDIQCKNRIDTLKKKYKIEKARVLDSGGAYTSPWPFFTRLDALLGPSFPVVGTTPPATSRRFTPPGMALSPVPVGPRSATPRRPAPLAVDDSFCFRRKFPAFAAAAAQQEDFSAGSRSSGGSGSKRRRKKRRRAESQDGYREVAEAIERLGDIYERVEEKKRRQMVELEKQRMQFAKELEFQRMQLFVETQVQLQKIKRAATKRSSGGETWDSFLFLQFKSLVIGALGGYQQSFLAQRYRWDSFRPESI